MYHLDSTYELLHDNKALYILAIKFELTHSLPLIWFIIKPDNSDNISNCLMKFFQRFIRGLTHFMNDCARNICKALKESLPEAEKSWCAFHVMRAIRANLYIFNDEEIRQLIVTKFNVLC